ncbi:Uncharacterised protein [Klebsiella pneumoniae]|uniref:Uncharacterized protein n=1 Tax=Klebsiella pneumoniae TaxID=573 RepID=A0A4P0XIT6_KLEPN|nr:Uncharacterised protein [Enterobacter hormaechei]VTM47981.1 Uncharacterised protein [Klebsiella pneumoniae]
MKDCTVAYTVSLIQYFLVSLVLCLFATVFPQRMHTFNTLFLPLSVAQLVLIRYCGHQIDKYVIDGGYHGAGDRINLRRILI